MKYPAIPPNWKSLLTKTFDKLGSAINTPTNKIPDSKKTPSLGQAQI